MNVRALKTRLNVIEVPSFEARRVHGKGYLKPIPDGWRVLKTIFRERFGDLDWKSILPSRSRTITDSLEE